MRQGFVVAEGESAEALPTDGAVDESKFAPDQLIGEIEDLAAGASEEVSLEMEAGDYVLFCNIVEELDDGTIESHFAKGMHSTFTVN